MRVFIVDDSAIVRERLAAMLSEMEGVEIIGHADRPFEAIKGILEMKLRA